MSNPIYKSEPIAIPIGDYDQFHPLDSLSGDFSSYTYDTPRYGISTSYISIINSEFNYSITLTDPNTPIDNTPPDKRRLQNTYMDLLANVYLLKSGC